MDEADKKYPISELEKNILGKWRENKIFEKSLEQTKKGKPFVFYDGPPFATGEPHYGHILAGTIKDAIPRYQTMRGRQVMRQWGWDCHGLPVENEIEKEQNLSHKKDIENFGVGNFNEAARKAVLRYDSLWKEVIPRMGRFVDMENAYKTMDATYSESIWWSFKTLYEKGLIYEGHKVMYVCPRCETPVSNFEVAQGYRDITDISVTVKLELLDEPETYLLAWTTTPWTLPGNTAIAVNANIKYSLVQTENGKYIVASELIDRTFKEEKTEVLKEFLGSELVGKKYKPLFDYYSSDGKIKNHGNGWKIYDAPYVTTETGTGIVHLAPAYGEEDMELSKKENIPVVHHVGIDGKFAPAVKDFAGMFVKQKGDTQSGDIEIIKYLAGKGTLFGKEKIVHSYPLCWRCDTPLLNYAIGSWFVNVLKIRDRVVEENKKIGWVPEHIGVGRFGKWLEGARDWAISRTRYWGAPLPVWKCSGCKSSRIFGSVAELEEDLPKQKNRYIIIRHGQSESNVKNLVDNDPENKDGLTTLGKEETIKSAKKIKSKIGKVDLIVTSDFVRTKETAFLLADALNIPREKIVEEKGFREINTGVFNGKPSGHYHGYFSSLLEKFTKRPNGGETLMDLKRRSGKALMDLEEKNEGKTILIVTHEYTAWMIYSMAGGLNEKRAVYEKEKKGNDFLKNSEWEEVKLRFIPRNLDYDLDLHRPYIDKMKPKCSCGGEMRRIEEVFDCWYESGSMPFARLHYPFENEKIFNKNYPADFIAEGLDQTRGWFYSLIILGVGLFDKTPYKNVIVNGIVLAEDGTKISKRLKNYPDPVEIADKYGADAMRYYLLSSPVVRGEDFSFSEKGVDEIYKKITMRLSNVVSFYELYKDETEHGLSDSSKNVLDEWIIGRLSETARQITAGFEDYELDKASKPIMSFVDDLSTWYLRRSRERFKRGDQDDKKRALETLSFVAIETAKLIAPIMPFIADDIYSRVLGSRGKESVHLENWPKPKKGNAKLIRAMEEVRSIVSKGLLERGKNGIKVRQPLSSMKVKIPFADEFAILIKDELNVKELVYDKKAVNPTFDLTITKELKDEGDFRELVRKIQEMRKRDKLTPKDIVSLNAKVGKRAHDLLNKYLDLAKSAALLKDIKMEIVENEAEDFLEGRFL